jgi:hypothetical protein
MEQEKKILQEKQEEQQKLEDKKEDQIPKEVCIFFLGIYNVSSLNRKNLNLEL